MGTAKAQSGQPEGEVDSNIASDALKWKHKAEDIAETSSAKPTISQRLQRGSQRLGKAIGKNFKKLFRAGKVGASKLVKAANDKINEVGEDGEKKFKLPEKITNGWEVAKAVAA